LGLHDGNISNGRNSSTGELFEEAFKLYLHRIEHYAFSYLKNQEESESIAQEAFFALWTNREKVDFENGVFPYLITVTRNKCLNLLKRQNNRLKFEKDEVKKFKLEINYTSLSDISSVNIYSKEVEEICHKTLESVSDKVKTTFLLNRTKRFSNEEVAKIQGISVKTVESRITFCLKLLRENLKDYLVHILGFILNQLFIFCTVFLWMTI